MLNKAIEELPRRQTKKTRLLGGFEKRLTHQNPPFLRNGNNSKNLLGTVRCHKTIITDKAEIVKAKSATIELRGL